MSRGFKSNEEYGQALLTTYEVIFNGLVSLEIPVYATGVQTIGDLLVQESFTAEDLLIKENAYELLSQEAKEVIRLVLDPPPKIKTKSQTQKEVSKTKLYRFLKSEKKWPARKIERCYQEIKNFTGVFTE